MAHRKAPDTMAEFLEEHPRMMGALFTICLLMMQAGNVMANAQSTTNGP
ncbi:hypothetical protein NGM10_00705 [Halorussus salilacus]|nr:hypothetical protein [Halorussus salilacus]USZ68277.1 hypothetical protein NGM10_00705 [Halorussus salilacus]